jgi:CRP-like cAMP-binding protein
MKLPDLLQVHPSQPGPLARRNPSGATVLGTDAFHAAMLQRIPLFACLGTEQRRRLAEGMHVQVFQPHEQIVNQGATSGALLVLQTGHAVMYRTDPQGREFILGDLRDGDHFGEMSLVDGLPHSASVRAVQRCIVLILGESDFARCLAADQPFCMQVLLGLTKRLRHATATIGTLALMDVRGRIAQKLLELSENVGGRQLIRGRLSRTELAKRVGASREMVSRILVEMQAQGLYDVDADGHLVLNLVPADEGLAAPAARRRTG